MGRITHGFMHCLVMIMMTMMMMITFILEAVVETKEHFASSCSL